MLWEAKMALAAIGRAAKLAISTLASVVVPIVDILSRKEEKALTAEMEKWIVARVIQYIVFSYPRNFPASKPCPERVVFKGAGWRAVFVERGLKLQGNAPAEIRDLLQRLEQEHILNLQNLLRFMCEHSRKLRTEVNGFGASSKVLGYVQPDEMSAEKSDLQAAVNEGFDLDFQWEAVKVLPAELSR
jgi:hypothetical protein